MMRQNAHARSSLAAVSIESQEERLRLRHSASPRRSSGRLLLAPLALLIAAITGAVFVILLPICGIATLSEAAARSCWSFVREAVGLPRAAVSHR